MFGRQILVFSFGLVVLLVSSFPQDENNLFDSTFSIAACDDDTPIRRIVKTRDSQDYSIDTTPQTQNDLPTTDGLDDSMNEGVQASSGTDDDFATTSINQVASDSSTETEYSSEMNDFTSTDETLLADGGDYPNERAPASLGWCPMGKFPACCFKQPPNRPGKSCKFWMGGINCDQQSVDRLDIGWFCCTPRLVWQQSLHEYESLPNVRTCEKISKGSPPKPIKKPVDIPDRKEEPESEPQHSNQNSACRARQFSPRDSRDFDHSTEKE